jgi:DNA-binding transcriptional LysR family regulator
MYDGPEFRQLRYFVAVADLCSFSKAAEKLHVSQPSLSTQIKLLEDGLNAKLFVRGPTGTYLTSAGRVFHAKAKQMLVLRQRAVEDTSIIHSGENLPLRIGYSPFVNHEIIREAMNVYRELVPDGKFESSSGSSPSLSRLVSEDQLDAAIVALPIAEKHLFIQAICTEKLMVCLREDDPLARHSSVARMEIEKRVKIVSSQTHHPLLYDHILQTLNRVGIALRPSEFVSSPEELQFLIKLRLGLGLVGETTPLAPELTKRPIAGVDIRIKTAFICHPAQQKSLFPILVYRLAQACAALNLRRAKKRPSRGVSPVDPEQLQMFG